MPRSHSHGNTGDRPGPSASVIMALIAVGLLVSFWFFFSKPNTAPDLTYEGPPGTPLIFDDRSMSEGDVMNIDDSLASDVSDYTGDVLAGYQTRLLDFTEADYEKAKASDKLIVLYFYANWCPICADETVNALYPAFYALQRDDVIGFRVNFNDSHTDAYERGLASEFGVAYQHTKVFVKDGKRILKSPESWSAERYLNEINAVE